MEGKAARRGRSWSRGILGISCRMVRLWRSHRLPLRLPLPRLFLSCFCAASSLVTVLALATAAACPIVLGAVVFFPSTVSPEFRHARAHR